MLHSFRFLTASLALVCVTLQHLGGILQLILLLVLPARALRDHSSLLPGWRRLSLPSFV